MEGLLVSSSFNIFGLEIPFYGLLMSIAFMVAFFVCLYFCKIRGYDKNLIFDVLLVVLPSSIIGARIYYIIFSNESWTFVKMLQVWNGGLAVYGGIIGGVIGIIIYCLIKKESIIKVFDLVAPALLIGQSIGRIGCYFAGCCYGKLVANESMKWFPLAVEMVDGWHYSTFFYESFWCLIGFVILFFLFRKIKIKGLYTSLYLIWYGFGRFIIEGIRSGEGGDSLSLFNSGLKVSQFLSVLVMIAGISLLIVFLTKERKSLKNNKE